MLGCVFMLVRADPVTDATHLTYVTSCLVLLVLVHAADFPAIDDCHDDRVAGTVLGRKRLARGTAGGDEDQFAGAGAHSIRRHHMAAGLLAFGIDGLYDHEFQAVHAGFLARRDDGANHFAKSHKRILPGRTLWPAPAVKLALLLGRLGAAAKRQHVVHAGVRARDDMDRDHFAHAAGGEAAG